MPFRHFAISKHALFEKPRFCDGLVWTVGLTVEIKLRFEISPAKCERCLPLCYGNFFFHLKIIFSSATWVSHWTVDLDTGGQWYGSRVVSVRLW